MHQEFLTALAQRFRCQIYGVKPRRNVLFLKTDRGGWVVKAYKDEEKAQWVTQLAQMLRDNGFAHTVHYLRTVDNETVFPFGSHYYTVMKAIEGREASYASISDIRKAAYTLARFHQVARYGNPVPLQIPCKPPLLAKWENRLEEFSQLAEQIAEKGPGNRFEAIIHRIAPEVINEGRRALAQSLQMPLFAEMKRAIGEGTVAHRDVASHNFLLTPTGQCYLIDLDTAHIDMQLADLVQFIGRMLLLQGYQPRVFTEVINVYRTLNRLDDSQVRMIFQLLRYPDNIMREVTGVYYRRPGYRMRGALHLLQLEGKYWRQRKRFLRAEPLVLGVGTFRSMDSTG